MALWEVQRRQGVGRFPYLWPQYSVTTHKRCVISLDPDPIFCLGLQSAAWQSKSNKSFEIRTVAAGNISMRRQRQGLKISRA